MTLAQRKSRFVWLLALAAGGVLGGCSSQPTASISDPSVYTMAHVVTAASASAGDSDAARIAVRQDVQRYLSESLVNAKVESEQTRVGLAMADDVKRQGLIKQILATSNSNSSGARNRSTPSTRPTQAKANWTGEQSAIQTYQALLEASTKESAEERLDKARDLYQAYLLKVLAQSGHDSRAIDPRILEQDSFGSSTTIYKTPAELRDFVAYLKKTSIPVTSAEIEQARREAGEAGSSYEEAKANFDRKDAGVAAAHARVDALSQMRENHTKTGAGVNPEQKELDAAQADYDQARADRDRSTAILEAAKMRMQTADKHFGASTAYLTQLQEQLENAESQIAEVNKAAETNPDRLVLVTFQTHVAPGNQANEMAGVRLKVVSAQLAKDAKVSSQRWPAAKNGNDSAGLVKFVALYPSRNSEVAQKLEFQKAREASAALIQSRSADEKSAEFAQAEQTDAQQQIQLLSKMSNVASFADATNHEVGWNFYPTQIQITQRSWLKQVADIATFQAPKKTSADAVLQAGARDCAAYVLVPRELQSITFQVDQVSGSVDGSNERRWRNASNAGLVTVTLPAWTPEESRCLSITPVLTAQGAQQPEEKKTFTNAADVND